MQPNDLFPRESGLPRWVLLATIPVVLSLGFVVGMGIATYTADPATGRNGALPAAESPDPLPTDPAPVATNPADDYSWQVPTSGLLSSKQLPLTQDPPVTIPELITSPPHTLPSPSATYNSPPQTIRDARTALAREFFRYNSGGTHVSFEYQQLRQSGDGTSLVGMISVADMATWEQILAEDQEGLALWLEAAARRVQAASQRDRFHLAWSVVDVLPTRPEGFADYEVTPLNDGTYLVMRPLATTIDYGGTRISLRPLDSLRLTAAGRPVAAGSPWATYRPVLHFNTKDIYRPTSALPATR